MGYHDGTCKLANHKHSFGYRKGDEIHLIHVIPRKQITTSLGAPPVDLLPQDNSASYEQHSLLAHQLIKSRFVPKLKGAKIPFSLHIVKVKFIAVDKSDDTHTKPLKWGSIPHRPTYCCNIHVYNL